MPTDVDRLSDLASAASHLAARTNQLSDHADAAKAHYAAYKGAVGAGKEDRPSLGESHLNRAAHHDKVAHDPESFEQKECLAEQARRAADREPVAAKMRVAAKASRTAAAAWRKQNPQSKDTYRAESFDRTAKNYDDQAAFLESKEGASTSTAEGLEERLGGAAKKAT